MVRGLSRMGPSRAVWQVGIHELLGHGSGKLFHEGTAGAKALVASQMAHPITGEAITGPFYPPGATWDSTFGKIASAYEECRAECAGIYLCLEPVPLAVFGHADATADSVHDISYINWLLMVRAGVCALEFYTPATSSFRQAHMWARYVILQVLLEAGDGLLTLHKAVGADGAPDFTLRLDREKIRTVGKPAIGRFLLALQTHKSLGDFPSGEAMFAKYSAVNPAMIEIRDIVMARKEPRKLLVQPHLTADTRGGVALQTFPSTPAGMIESFVARFPAEDPALLELYQAEVAAL